MNIALWIIQALLAALFLFAGGMKLITPIEEMTKQIAMPGWFLRFIGVAEVLGAIGLILPMAFQSSSRPHAACRRWVERHHDRGDRGNYDHW